MNLRKSAFSNAMGPHRMEKSSFTDEEVLGYQDEMKPPRRYLAAVVVETNIRQGWVNLRMNPL